MSKIRDAIHEIAADPCNAVRHDARNGLASVVGGASLLRKAYLKKPTMSEVDSFLRMIEVGSYRIQNALDNCKSR